jgi:DcmR-like sensory protein
MHVMVSKEKLVDGNLESILRLLCETRYGEHNIVIYPNLDSFKEIYTHLTKTRIENNNDRVLLLPHYETSKSVQQALMELDIKAKEQIERGSLEIMDSQHAFFDPAQNFVTTVEASAIDALRSSKSGVIAIADMGSFFHRQQLDGLISHECGICAQSESSKFTVFCCYHSRDFEKLTREQEAKLCENHYRNLFVRETSID